jgi:hypothetical protein
MMTELKLESEMLVCMTHLRQLPTQEEFNVNLVIVKDK